MIHSLQANNRGNKMDNMNKLSHWQLGERVRGLYMGVPFSGELNAYCRPTHDYKNMIFCVTLDKVIGVFGRDRTTVEVWTNHMSLENTLELEAA
jgi:hypothetical protein